MNLRPDNQTKLFGLKKFLNELIKLYETKSLPKKILLSGQRGLGKSTMAYHLINYILSKGEEFPYDINKNEINLLNKSFKLIQNRSSMNFELIDIFIDKKNIDINQIRTLIQNLRKSSLNNKPRFVLIDNIEYLNKNSINAFLKILEEPNDNIYFIMINNNKKILPTLKSRFLEFKIFLSNREIRLACNDLLGDNLLQLINEELLDYYITPGKIFNLVKFSVENSINLKKSNLNEFLSIIIDKSYYKKDSSIKYFVNDFFELFLSKKVSSKYLDFRNYFLKQIDHIKRYNLDEESLFIEFKNKLLNG
tara:strand:+ start:87 stop:1007 length:921 start_codon:yes stop_codon:yes gene_type:complete